MNVMSLIVSRGLFYFRRWLAPPVFDDEDKTRTAAIFNSLILPLVALLLGTLALRVILGMANPRIMPIGLILCALLLSIREIARRGHVQFAITLFCSVLLLGISLGIYNNGTVRAMGTAAMIICVVVPTILVGSSTGLIFLGLTVAFIFGLAQAEIAGALPSLSPATLSPTSQWITLTAIILFHWALVGMVRNSLTEALTRIRYENAARQHAEENLRKLNALLETRVAERTAELEREIVDRKQAEELFSKAFLFSPVGVAITNLADGTFIDANDSYLRMLEYPREEVIRHTSIELNMLNAGERAKLIQALREQGKMLNIEVQMQAKSGRLVDVLFSSQQIDLNSVASAVAITIDVTERKRVEELLRQSEEKLRTLFDTLSEGVALNEIIYNENGEMVDYRILEVNKAFYTTADYEANQVIGKVATKLYGMSSSTIKSFWEGHKNVSGTVYTEMHSSLNNRHYFIATSPFTNGKFVTSFLDITKRKQTETILQEKESQIRALGDNLPNGYVYQFDLGVDGTLRRFLYISAGVERLFGISAQEVLDNPLTIHERFMEEDNARVAVIEASALASMTPFVAESRYRNGNGHIRWMLIHSTPRKLENNHILWDGFALDITERKQAEESLRTAHGQLQAQLAKIEELHTELHEQAVRDPLTGLYNRRYLFEALAREAPRAIRGGYPISIILLDIDKFKAINDTFGHDAGDKALQVLAAQLQALSRVEDVICRYGGDEHLVVMYNTTAEKAVERADQLRKAVASQHVSHDGQSFQFTSSFGVAVFPIHAATIEEVISIADRALYHSKEMGRNCVTIL